MKKLKFDMIYEKTIERHQQAGFLTGDYVVLKKDAFSHEYIKNLPESSKQFLRDIQKSDKYFRISYVKTQYPSTSTTSVGAPETPGSLWADVYVEYAPGLWKDAFTLPIEVLEHVKIDGANGYPPYPKSLKRNNDYSTEPNAQTNDLSDSDHNDFNKNHNLPQKNTKI